MRLAFALALVAAALPARAQHADAQALRGPLTLCVLMADEVEAVQQHARALRTLPAPSERRATFEIDYTGFTSESRPAFQAAVDIWSTMIESPQTIRIAASFEPLGTDVLGSAGAGGLRALGPGTVPNTWYGLPLYDALTGTNLDGNSPDIVARFSSTFGRWYYGLDGNPGASEVDFVTVVLHEIGHGLGVFGSATVENNSGAWGISNGAVEFPVIYDRFAQSESGTAMLNTAAYPNPSPQLALFLQSSEVEFGASTVVQENGGTPAQLYAPTTWRQGSSFAHWDETTYPPSSPNALMTPFVANGEAQSAPGPLTCALLKDIGWTLGPGCAAVVPTDAAPSAGPLVLEMAGPNPFRASTALRLRLAEPGAVRAVLLDALGRDVEVLYSGAAAAGPLVLPVSAHLAPGVYTAHVNAEGVIATRRLVRAR